jgi:DNA-binding IclR family transcriptional regulator
MQPLMDEVSTKAKEICSLAVLDGDEALFMGRASPARVFPSGINTGTDCQHFAPRSDGCCLVVSRMRNSQLRSMR